MSKITTYHLVIFQGRNHQARLRMIGRNLVTHVQEQLEQLIKTKPQHTHIVVWLDSPGGDAHAAYKLFLELRSRCDRLTAVVPDLAKSAASLFLLGVDEIYMAAGAEMGPLDVQISHPDREDQVISGLDVAGSLEYLSEFAMNLVLSGGAAVIESTELPRLEVLKSMQGFAAQFLQPCVAKLDPTITRRAVSQLKVAEHYANAMLVKRNLVDGDKRKQTPAVTKRLVSQLVKEYPVHEFVISREEATSLGLPIRNAEDRSDWKMIKSIHSQFLKNDQSVIKAFIDPVHLSNKKHGAAAVQKPHKVQKSPTKPAGKATSNHAKNTQTSGADGGKPNAGVQNGNVEKALGLLGG